MRDCASGVFMRATASSCWISPTGSSCVHHYGASRYAGDEGEQYQAHQVEQILVPKKEPLALEHEHFLQVMRTGTPPATDAETALAGLKLAQAIQQSIT